MFKCSTGHTTSREYSILFLKTYYMYILRMASYKCQKNTQETAMENKSKSMSYGLVCEIHALLFRL